MKCEKCGNDIVDGHLLCEKCGAEIQIVPNFEPEVERSILESLTSVAEDLTTPSEDGSIHEYRESHKNIFVISLGCVFVFAIIVLIVIYSIISYRKSAVFLVKQASQNMDNSNYDQAVSYLHNALEAEGDFVNIKFILSDCYLKLEQNDLFINTILDIIKYPMVKEEELAIAYERLIQFYDERGMFEQINSLLLSCQNQQIKENYSQYIADVPEFNYLEGSYNEVIPLKILGNTKGHIYYTMDGSLPSINSHEYTSPIFLETGDYEITAVFINEYGIVSPLAKATYHVDVSPPFAPEVDTYSGDYYTPQLIHVEAEEGCSIYYTSDDTEPNEQSTLYNDFLPMPLGKSTYKFVAVDGNGLSSEVTVRNYNLGLITDHDMEEGIHLIYKYMLDSGRIYQIDGQISEGDLRKMVYVFACCTTIVDEGDFYIYSEYIQNIDGTKEKTGNYYAVGIYNLPLYGTQYDPVTQNFALTTELLTSGT